MKLTQRFFDENLKSGVTVARMLYFKLAFPEMKDAVSDVYLNIISETEQSKILTEADAISRLNDVEGIIKKLRGDCYQTNLPILIEKVLDRENEMIPQLIHMLIRSGNHNFIERMAEIIPKCAMNRASEIQAILPDVRNPYAQSCASLVLGYIGDETVIPLLYDAFSQLKVMYPKEAYEQGPLIGLEHIFRNSQD